MGVLRKLRERGHSAYFVGGCVRDLLLGLVPQDYDIATSARPKEVMSIFPETIAVGARFGVVLVVVRPQSFADAAPISIEVATYRSDVGYSDGRHPDAVRYSNTAEEDVQRRDFTVNGLLLDPITDEVLDYVGGRSDLERKILRTIGDPDTRFREDKLRMMRAVRFAARLGYQIEDNTNRAIRELAAEIHQESRERIRDELDKMLTEGRARRCFELLDTTGLLVKVLPEVSAMKAVEQPPQYHPEGDVWIHTLLLLEGLEKGCPKPLAWESCCTTSASRQRFALLPTEFVLTVTRKLEREWPRRSVAACDSQTMTPSRCLRSWPITCASETQRK